MANNKQNVVLEQLTQTEKKKKSAGNKGKRTGFLGRSVDKIFGFMKKKKGETTVEADLASTDDTATEDKGNQFPKIPTAAERVMEKFLEKTASTGMKKLKAEWLEVASHMPLNVSATLYEFNTLKNFPGGSPCLDSTRVSLTFNVPPETDYIHANWVQTKFCSLGLRLILTQAPQDVTVNDFYRCIWQEKVRSIVMLCEKYEGNRRVCPQYWPLVVGTAKMYGVLRVQYLGNVTPDHETAYTKMHLLISYKSEKALDSFIYVCKTWPEGGAPVSGLSILRTIRAVNDEGPSTVLVHGGAGTGRTGVFVATMIAQKVLLEGRDANILAIAQELREQRMGAINTELQYLTIYKALCEYIRAKHINTALSKQLIKHFDKYKKEYIAAGNQPVDVKSGPFEINSAAAKASAGNVGTPTQAIRQQTQNPSTPTNLVTQPMTADSGSPVPMQSTPTQPDNKGGDEQYVVLNALNAMPPPPGNK